MIVMGIDPGLAIVGYGIVEVVGGNFRVIDFGVLRTEKGVPLPRRLLEIEKGLSQLVEKYQIEQVAVEELFFSKNVTTAIAVAEARGVILLTLEKLLTGEVFEYTPNQIKQALTGYGSADKKQIQMMVQRFLRLKDLPRPDDAADALAVAICHGQTSRLMGDFKIK